MAGKKNNSAASRKPKAKQEKQPKKTVKLSEEDEKKRKLLEERVKESVKTINNPIFNLFFRSGHIPGAIYDAPTSRIYRAQTALRSLLREYKPSSEVVFHDVYRPSPVCTRLEGRCLWLSGDEEAQHWSVYDSSEKLGGGAGARRKARFESLVKNYLSRITSIVKKFK